MGTLQHEVGGPSVAPVSDSHRTFKDVLHSHVVQAPPVSDPLPYVAMHAIDTTPTGLHRGSPAIFFQPPDLLHLNKPFEWSLIGKFSSGYNRTNPKLGRPSIDTLRDYFTALDLKGDFQVGLLDNRHVLIQLRLQPDYLRLYSRSVWYIAGQPMRIFKWSPDFHVDKESSIAPVWVAFPRLPVQFFQHNALFAIGRLLGVPLRIDAATAALKRPSVARLQLEIDVLKSLPERIWIGMGSDGQGFWQRLEFENVPAYCTHCWHMGHSEALCTVFHPELKKPATNKAKVVSQVYVKKPQQESLTAQLDVPSTSAQAALPQQPTPANSPVQPAPVPAVSQRLEPSPSALAPSSPLAVTPAPLIAHEIGFQPMVVEEVPDSDDDVPVVFHEEPVPAHTAFQSVSCGSVPAMPHLSFPSTSPPPERVVVSASKSDISHVSRSQIFQDFREFSKHLDMLLPPIQSLVPLPRKRGRPRKGFFQSTRSQSQPRTMLTRSLTMLPHSSDV